MNSVHAREPLRTQDPRTLGSSEPTPEDSPSASSVWRKPTPRGSSRGVPERRPGDPSGAFPGTRPRGPLRRSTAAVPDGFGPGISTWLDPLLVLSDEIRRRRVSGSATTGSSGAAEPSRRGGGWRRGANGAGATADGAARRLGIQQRGPPGAADVGISAGRGGAAGGGWRPASPGGGRPSAAPPGGRAARRGSRSPRPG